jgi:hypothetical protein
MCCEGVAEGRSQGATEDWRAVSDRGAGAGLRPRHGRLALRGGWRAAGSGLAGSLSEILRAIRAASSSATFLGAGGWAWAVWLALLAAWMARVSAPPRPWTSGSSTPSSTISAPWTMPFVSRCPTVAWPVSSLIRCALSTRDQRGLGIPDSGTRMRMPTPSAASGSPRAGPTTRCCSYILWSSLV